MPSVLKENTPETKNRVLSEGIYAFFEQKYGIRQPKPSKQQRKRDKHERALRKVTQLKKNARKELRTAKALGLPSENIQPIAQTFFNLVREHSHLKRASQSSQKQTQMSKTRQSCHHHFWQFAKQLLDENSTNQPQPQFGEAEATSYFREVYHADTQHFSQPTWMPSPPPPENEFCCDEFAVGEIQAAIKRMKSSSSPSPFDRITYRIFKRCPALSKALCDLFNSCWTLSVIPSQWKLAAIKLIGKSSAEEDSTSPSNFRPIALTSCIGKLFTTILRNRWLSYMMSNGYLDPSIQKAFMPTTPGCVEHHLKLAAILAEAKKKHKSLAVCWLDLANAYGSVHHSLI